MHEFSMAQNVLEIVEENVAKHHATIVNELTLDIGSMAGIEIEALKTAMEVVQQDTILQNAVIHYHIIKAIAICKSCKSNFEPFEIFDACPNCKQFGIEIISGKELVVKSIVAE